MELKRKTKESESEPVQTSQPKKVKDETSVSVYCTILEMVALLLHSKVAKGDTQSTSTLCWNGAGTLYLTNQANCDFQEVTLKDVKEYLNSIGQLTQEEYIKECFNEAADRR